MSKRKVYLTTDAHARLCVMGVMNSRGEFLCSRRYDTCETELIKHVEDVGTNKKILAIEEGPLA